MKPEHFNYRSAWLAEQRMALGINRPTSFTLVTGLVDSGTPTEIMDELREVDPKAAAMLGEYVVIEDDGTMGKESIDALCGLIRSATEPKQAADV